MEGKEDIKELALLVVTKLVDEPDNVEIVEKEEDGVTVFEPLGVAKDDIGKVIGREGQNIKAIRTIIQACGRKRNIKCTLRFSGTK